MAKWKKILTSVISIILLIQITAIPSFATYNIRVLNKGELPVLLKYKNIRIGTTLAKASIDGKEYPVYCLDVEKDGVGENGTKEYNVKDGGIIENDLVYRGIINGYPYKSFKELNVESEAEAFTATKQAVYTLLYGRNTSSYSGINTPAGRRTYEAYKKIVDTARREQGKYIEGSIEIKELSSNWENVDKLGKKIRKKIEVSSKFKGDIDINLKAEIPIKIEDLKGKNLTKLKRNQEAYIVIESKDIKEKGSIKIKAEGKLKTNPVYVGLPEKSTNQRYAISGFRFSSKVYKDLEIPYNPSENPFILKKYEKDKEIPLKGAQFEIKDEKNNVVGTYITDENGEITLENLSPGIYYIKEKAAPNGYKLSEKEYTINIKRNEKSTLKIENEKLQIITKKKKLPKTGY